MNLHGAAAKFTRDRMITGVALGGVIYETVIEHADRLPLLALYGSMLGLPLFLRSDERNKPPSSGGGAGDA